MRLLEAALCASYFLVWPSNALQQPQAGQVSKEGHPVGPPSPLRVAGSQSGVAFPEGTSMYRPETLRIVRNALRVSAPPACRASTGFGSRSGARVCLTISNLNPDAKKHEPFEGNLVRLKAFVQYGLAATISQLLNGVSPYSGSNVVCRPAPSSCARRASASG